MSVFTVQRVKQVDSGTDKNGKPWQKVKCRLETPEGVKDVLLYCPQWNPPPAEGSTLEGEIGKPFREGQLPEFERPRGGAYNGRSGAGKSYQADPAKLEVERAKNRSIAAESAQKSAVEILRIAVECGAYKPPEANPISEMTTVVRSAAESLYAQIQQASEAAK